MPIENKLCECGCGRSRPMSKGGRFFEPYCKVRWHRSNTPGYKTKYKKTKPKASEGNA